MKRTASSDPQSTEHCQRRKFNSLEAKVLLEFHSFVNVKFIISSNSLGIRNMKDEWLKKINEIMLWIHFESHLIENSC